MGARVKWGRKTEGSDDECFTPSSHSEGGSRKISLGYLKGRACGKVVSMRIGLEVAAVQSGLHRKVIGVGDKPNCQSIRNNVFLGKLSTSHTVLVYNESERSTPVAVGTARILPNIVRELRGRSGRSIVKGDGNDVTRQEFEP